MTTSPFKPGNANIYCQPVDWNVACALTQMRAGVELTPTQKAMFARIEAQRTGQADIEAFLEEKPKKDRPDKERILKIAKEGQQSIIC